MTWGAQEWLWLLIFPVLAQLVMVFRRKDKDVEKIWPHIKRMQASKSVLKPIRVMQTRVRYIFLWAGISLLIVSIARPKWGDLEEPVFDQAREVLIALDLSRSMLAEDVKPSRLTKAKLMIQDLLNGLKDERVGLLLFSGTSFLQSPLSADYQILEDFLPDLTPDYLPTGSTNFANMLREAERSFSPVDESSSDRFLIILSDGESDSKEWKTIAQKFAKNKIHILALGIGTAEGSFIPDGKGGFLKDRNGAVVQSKLNRNTLSQLAEMTNGVYQDVSGWADLQKLLAETVETSQAGEFVETKTVRQSERFQLFLAPAILFILFSICRDYPSLPKPRKMATIQSLLFLIFVCNFLINVPLSAQLPGTETEKSLPAFIFELTEKDQLSALDYAEISNANIDYAQKELVQQSLPPEGILKDTQRAIDEGEQKFPNAPYWEELKQKLAALKKQMEEQEKPNNEESDQNDKSEEDKDQKEDENSSKDKDEDSKKEDKNGDETEQNNDSENSEQSQGGNTEQKDDGNQTPSGTGEKNEQSKMGELKDPSSEEAEASFPSEENNSEETQTVGGTVQESDQSLAENPGLAEAIQKLKRAENSDSPAKLFQLLNPEKRESSNKEKGKNW
jgi:Ca-activated chloride channel family protein